jgi:tRNA(fMet)-specific endonuclease VapC
MNYLLDTNIILRLLQSNKKSAQISNKFDLFSPQNTMMVSVVTVGELKSFALRNNWKEKKINEMTILVEKMLVIGIHNQLIFDKYAEIDTFSREKLSNHFVSDTAINMGKNDLWIAATAAAYNLTLLTTDNDFQHLADTFLILEHVKL